MDNKSAQGLQRLNTVVKSILLRRTKEDLKAQGELQDLPTKDIKTVYVELDEDEEKVLDKLICIFFKDLVFLTLIFFFRFTMKFLRFRKIF